MTWLDTDPQVADVCGLQTFVVDDVIRRDLGDGIASIINCRRINGVLVPQCEIIITAANLGPICRSAAEFAAELQQRQIARLTEVMRARH